MINIKQMYKLFIKQTYIHFVLKCKQYFIYVNIITILTCFENICKCFISQGKLKMLAIIFQSSRIHKKIDGKPNLRKRVIDDIVE